MQHLSATQRFSATDQQLDAYLDQHWDTMQADIAKLVGIASTEDLTEAAPGAPFGPGPRAALTAVLDIAADMGFRTHDEDGFLGWAELPGAADTHCEETASPDAIPAACADAAAAGTAACADDSARPAAARSTCAESDMLGIIGHVDVVPAGPGWHFPPFEVTEKDGYLIGRGVVDDKGPTVICLHALKFWADQLAAAGTAFPRTVRFLFGSSEETGMADVDYYLSRHGSPAFLFTPDADFPVCYGEKGQFGCMLTSEPIVDGRILELSGGVAPNAVPGLAGAVIRTDTGTTPPAAENIQLQKVREGIWYIRATGKNAHASTPELGQNAINILLEYLLRYELLSADERRFFQPIAQATGDFTGAFAGIDCADADFGPLTIVGGVAETVQPGSSDTFDFQCEGTPFPQETRTSDAPRRFTQTLDCRYPRCTTGEEIHEALARFFGPSGAELTPICDNKPFFMEPDSPIIQALIDAFNEATGLDAEPFTMGGGTYARKFARAASFGPVMDWVQNPEWVGTVHGPDEGASIDLLKSAFKIWAKTIGKLMELDLSAL